MRKLTLFLFASLVAGVANAQYFQHMYGDARRDFLESGINTDLATSQQGHLMTGYTDLVGIDNLVVTKTDLDGRFVTPPTFNLRFAMTENSVSVDAKGRRILQPAPMGGRILVWGDYGYVPQGVSTKFFLSLLNPNGAVGFVFSYQLPYRVAEAEATSMSFSTSNPNNVFVCGFVRLVAGGQRYPVVMCLNAGNGAVIWSWLYTVNVNADWWAMDLVESPYASPNAPEVALTGHFIRPGLTESGCFWRVSALNGAMLFPNVVEYGTPFSTNAGGLNAIDIANNPFGNGPGFVMGGYYNNPSTGDNDFWAIKVSPNGMAIDFNTTIDYSMPGNNETANDIIERRSTLPAPYDYEYYLGGDVFKGVFGGTDAVVQKLDYTGTPYYPRPQFTYGGPGEEHAYQLDQYSPFALPYNNAGLSTFGTTDGSFSGPGGLDFYFVKSYFNGVTACQYDLQDPPYSNGPRIAEIWSGNWQDQFNQGQLSMVRAGMRERELCWVPFDGTGNNMRLAPEETTGQLFQPGYFPNPVSRDNALVTVTFGNEAVDGNAEIELWNAVGQLVWKKSAPVAKGQTTMQVALGDELEGGMYHLVVRQNGALNNYRILVQ